jgi:hypothetical protein
MLIDLTTTVIILVILVERDLVVYPHTDEHSYAHANCKAGDIDEGIPGTTPDISNCNFEIVSDHRSYQLGLHET